MATRRPASSRAKYNGELPSSHPPRSRSALAKSIAAPTSQPALHLEQSPDTTLQRTKNKEHGETNIQVILRCRSRSEREMQENSPSIIQIDGPKSKDLTVETAMPVSSLGLYTAPPTRTYPFDLVFGPEATQSMVYHDVVGPMLHEVLMGYNCTLFAYGQTGTGKTYTMQGDLCPTPMGNPSAHAGIIPRVLFRLFHELEKSYTDFVVKISFVELYNEELRDLLSNDLPAPTALTQPMGLAAKDARITDGGLKMFDEANKRGVFIQGLDEIAVTDSAHALALLTKGSERRQIAATKFNDHSSRSHSVFSITVHLREKNNIGDDLLKIGKLNLVDLAGSENIGRSGAENKRAREAGMINQSLLTLGRVINALVDKAQHVPYRESKLTRLLQDSLGGRTKTCIIATISPARSNLEETLSTLDYALRAKSIRNKPEVNQRMNRNSLLKEYVTEIDRLKSDLLAAREKNGIYFSEESWNKMNAEMELRQTELAEAKKQVTFIENQLRVVRDEYDQSIAVLKKKEHDLHLTKASLVLKEEELRQSELQLQRATNAFEDEVVVRQAHQETETVLNDVAIGLKGIAAQSLHDVAGLLDKIDRKNKVLHSNKQVILESHKPIQVGTHALMQKLAEMSQISQSLRTNLEHATRQYQSIEKRAYAEHTLQTSAYFSAIQQSFQIVKDQSIIESDALLALERELQSAMSLFNEQASLWTTELTISCSRISKESIDTTEKQGTLLDQSIDLFYSLLESVCQEVQIYLKEEQGSATTTYQATTKMVAEEIGRLQRQNEILTQMLADERENSAKTKTDLLRRVSDLLGDFLQERDESLRQSAANLQQSNKEVEELLTATSKQQSKAYNEMTHLNDKMGRHLRETGKHGLETKRTVVEASHKIREVVKVGMEQMQRTSSNSASSYSCWTHSRSKEMVEVCGHAFEEYSRAKKARIEAADTLASTVEQLHDLGQSGMASNSKREEEHTRKALASIQEHERGTKDYEDFARDNLKSIELAANNLLSKGIKDDAATGSTPRKRKWKYTDSWFLTKSRDELLSSRNRGVNDVEVLNDLVDDIKVSDIANIENDIQGHLSVAKLEVTAKEIGPVVPLVDSRRRNTSMIRSSRHPR